MIKAIFFDMDGTLVAHPEGVVPASAREALARVRAKGVKIFLATGRHKLELEDSPLLRGVEIDGCAALNGQYCYVDGEVIHKKCLDHADMACFFQELRENPFPCIFEEENAIYGNFLDERLATIMETVSIEVPEFRSIEGLEDHDFYQLIPVCDEATLAVLLARMPHSAIANWGKYINDLIPKDGGKVAGIEALLKHFGFGWDEVMAFGDGLNDLGMLKAASLSVAMGNGHPHLKEAAAYVTADVHADGVALALKRFGLIE